MPEDSKSFINLVNSSGFLFQYAVEQEVRSTYTSHAYQVAASEYHWKSREMALDGYIDLILERDAVRMVVECKRIKDTNWLFLVDEAAKKSNRARLLWTQGQLEKPARLGWDELGVRPDCPEASICVMRGQSERDKPIIERILSTLTSSVESLALEELRFKQSYSKRRIYVPVIVTNGDLEVCHFDARAVDLSTGELPEDKARIEMVPFVRFRKTLSTIIENSSHISELSDANSLKERTIFIVKASELSRFLQEWTAFPTGLFSKAPWDVE